MIKYIALALLLVSSTYAQNSVWLVDMNSLIDKEIKCLADNIYFEARNESLKGQLAVAHVTINRVKSKHYPNNICKVVWEQGMSRKTNRKTAQFSWTLDGLSDIPKNGKAYQQATSIAEFLVKARISGKHIPDTTQGATHYHATYVTPYWVSTLKRLASIDNHIFYRIKK